MHGKFKYQNYIKRWIVSLPFLIIYIFFMAEMFFGKIQSDILYYVLNVAGLILILAIYYGITRIKSFFVYEGSWYMIDGILTLDMDGLIINATIGNIEKMSFVTNKLLLRSIAHFNLMEIHTDNDKIKIFSPDLENGADYDSELYSVYKAVKQNAPHLKLGTEIPGKKEINEWLSKK